MQTTLYMLTETSKFMMSFVIVTEKGNCIVIDGGRPEDMPLLKQYVAGRHISAWILTHAHADHISGFIDEMAKNGGADFDFEKVYYNFPEYDALIHKTEGVPDVPYFREELNEMLPAFNKIRDKIRNKSHIVRQGEQIRIDEVTVDFLFTFHDGLYSNLMNDSSLVFRLYTPRKSVLFLGDLGPEGGDELFRESRDKLKSDMVQMAHHGHMNVSMEVYAAIEPKACLWCCAHWLYNEPEVPGYLSDVPRLRRMGRIRMYGTAVTRHWMEQLGVREHYVTGDGTQTILL